MATNLEVVGSNPRLASFFYRVAIFTNSFAIDEKRKERRGIVQKRAFILGRCGDDRVSTMRSEEGMDVQKKASVGGIFIEC